MNSPIFIADSPIRAPHWRWLRVLQINSGNGRRASRKIDGLNGFVWIRRALRFKRHYDALNTQPDAIYALLNIDKDLFWAYSMWSDDKAPTRWGIEARVLAGETDEQIASKLGTKPSIISAFVNVFFDVREKLQNMDYMVNVVMANAVTRGLQERQYDLLWKLLGFHGGPHVLDAVINKFTQTDRPTTPHGVTNFFQDFAMNSIKYKAALAAVTVQSNSHTQLPLLDMYAKYVEIEKNTDGSSRAQHTIVENIGAMLNSIQFNVGTKLDSEALKMLPFDNSAAELNNNELMTLRAGGEVANQQEIQNLRFPEK
ncbi:hypothetical protein EBZ39_02660 [bacterium]|nr:hypothetical protein [bacterium]